MIKSPQHPADDHERQRALDPALSFIVQAPAGSGKTGLITQRFLRLLTTVQSPEEVLAITFTKKAAAEMRERILAALTAARDTPMPADEHGRVTWQLAQTVLQHERVLEWNLLEMPGRLRIQTIDSLCAYLTRSMPVMSGFGAQPRITEEATELYREAVRRTLEHLEEGYDWSPAIEALIDHLDNQLSLVESLLIEMLAKRDQWLRHVQQGRDHPAARELLERTLAAIISDALAHVDRVLPAHYRQELLSVAQFAGGNVEKTHRLACLAELNKLPEFTVSALSTWLTITGLLLTNDNSWRKRVDKNSGFPAPSSANNSQEKAALQVMKERMVALLAGLAAEPEVLTSLARLSQLPTPRYSDGQWQLLEALFELLPITAAQLHLVFAEQGCVDFSEVARSANHALGDDEAPTDLALALDYRIQHLLVDEFQDTSFGQYQLLERLTAGWQRGDGRTLFLVGDPMQSIYRFREAEVGLFLRARRYGIGEIALVPLTLTVNFRSQQGVVAWVNGAFEKILPSEESMESGAVVYTPSVAAHPARDEDAVVVHPQLAKDQATEALAV
ncbi:MAG: UvrD/REP helicase, partial [Halothiobacillaceae bacterium]